MKKRMKNLAALALAGLMALSAIPVVSGKSIVHAADMEAAFTKGTGGKVTIGNSYITRTFSTDGGVLKTTEIDNKRAGLKFAPADGSEEFIIKLRSDKVLLNGEIDRSNWKVQASSQHSDQIGAADGPAAHLIDGDEGTIWHSNYSNAELNKYPHWIIFDMQKEETIQSFGYLPRQDSENGKIKEYNLYVGNSEGHDALKNESNLAAHGTMTYHDRDWVYIDLDRAATGRYVMLEAISPNNESQTFACGAEVKMFTKPVSEIQVADESQMIRASDLKLKTSGVKSEDTDTGIAVKFPFETVNKNGVNWNITMNITMDDGKHYMRKFLEIEADKPEQAAIDYIDLESMNVNNSDATWTHPEMEGGVGGMSGYVISLGQPVYIQGMFFGSEFPMTETEIDSNKNAHMRYYTGKNFNQLREDNQLTLEDVYVTWPTVAGAARSTDMNVIQSDFYEYINDISVKTELRTQYNSWYDNMMFIDDANIEDIFVKTEKGLSESGVPPLDSYVVDDGWNNYNRTVQTAGTDRARRSGTTVNQTGFWEFNEKFPQGFGPSAKLAQSFGSRFGVWLGPRGGYNYNGDMGQIIEKGGYGAYNSASGDIDVGDRRYIRKLTEYFSSMQDTYKINYWKLDGFATKACGNKQHDHMTGGANGMYYFTDTWEGWIDLFEALRANAEKNGIPNLWFNLTCYVNPSPWLLQWGNSVWIQNSNDMGRALGGQQSAQVDQLLSYRDGRYFDFVKTRQFQFPLSNIFNHDPIYGKTDTNLKGTMNDQEFQAYLYMMGTRGTAFWEMLYSPEMIDEGQKWAINAEFLAWERENYHILKNAKLLGDTPDGEANTYGYSCWDGEEGIISMRNPSNQVKTLSFDLNRNIGAAETLNEGGKKTLYRTTLLDFRTTDAQTEYKTLKYGDKVTITLQPGEARIWKLSTENDTEPAKVQTVNVTETVENGQVTGKSVKVTFDERIKTSGVTSDKGAASVTADGRSVVVALTDDVDDGEKVTVTLAGVTDLSGNTKEYPVEAVYHADGIMVKAYEASDLKNGADVTDGAGLSGKTVLNVNKQYDLNGSGYEGATDFSVSTYIKTTGKNVNLLSQGKEFSLALDKEGRVVFTVGDVSVTSAQKVNDGEWRHVAGIREKNGVIKVYVDGSIEASVYAKDVKDIKSGTVKLGASGLTAAISEAAVRNGTLSLTALSACEDTVKEAATVVKYKVMFQTNGGSDIDELKVAAGESWQLPEAPTKEGYRFDGWYTDVNCMVKFGVPTALSEDLFLYAKWKKLYRVDIYSYDDLGFDSLEIEENTKIEDLTAVKRPGTTFEGWYTDYARTQKFDENTLINSNITLYPKYTMDREITDALKELKDEINEKTEVERGNYTQEAWSKFEAALQAAQSAAKDSTTKAQLNDARAALQAAFDALQGKSTPQTPGSSVAPGTSAGTSKLAAPVVAVKSTWEGVRVTWNAISGAGSYTVSRNGKVMETVTATSWLDRKPLGGKVNTYQVTANGDDIKTLTSAPGSRATGKLPKAAAKLKAKKTGKKVTLKWKKVKKASYVVLRATKKNGAYKKIKTIKKNTYTDRKAKGKSVFYKVVVKSGKLYSPASTVKKVKL